MRTECGERGKGHWGGLGIAGKDTGDIRKAGRKLKRIRDCWKDTEEDKGLLEEH